MADDQPTSSEYRWARQVSAVLLIAVVVLIVVLDVVVEGHEVSPPVLVPLLLTSGVRIQPLASEGSTGVGTLESCLTTPARTRGGRAHRTRGGFCWFVRSGTVAGTSGCYRSPQTALSEDHARVIGNSSDDGAGDQPIHP